MVAVIAEFFQVVGVDSTSPETMSELILWMALIYIGVHLVCAVFRLLGKCMELFLNRRRF